MKLAEHAGLAPVLRCSSSWNLGTLSSGEDVVEQRCSPYDANPRLREKEPAEHGIRASLHRLP
jgi:hypothetical protein